MLRSILRETLKTEILTISSKICVNPIWKRNILTNIEPKEAGDMKMVKSIMMKSLGLEERYQPIPKSRENLLKYHPKIEELPSRSMADSYTSVTVPISSDATLHNFYVSILGNVRIGRLFEDMDMFAVWVCHQYLKIPNLPENVPLPYTFVTILVDRVNINKNFVGKMNDMRLVGHVSGVGKTSVEITVTLQFKSDTGYVPFTQAYFLMGARNATNTGSAPINPLKPANAEEQKIFDDYAERNKRRRKIQAASVFKTEPTDYEQSLMYSLFNRTQPSNTKALNIRELPANCCWITDSFASNTLSSFPENRNAHNKVFGGFLMRNALEISWAV